MKSKTASNRKTRRTAFARKTYRPEDIEQVYGYPMGSLANDRSNGVGPRYFKVGRKIFYYADEFENWLTSQPVQTKDSARRCE